MTVDLMLGDCLERMAEIADGSVAHIVTDPPYGQTNESYESGIAFDPKLWTECYRVAGPNAALISFAGSPTYHKIATAIENGGWKVRQMWGWVYRDGMITSAYPKEGFDRLAPAMDPIVFATKGKVLLNLAREGDHAWHGGNTNGLSERSAAPDGHEFQYVKGKGRWPRSLTSDVETPGFEYFASSRRRNWHAGENVGHPNQKPLALMRWLIGKLPKSDLPILDPFAGSATTLDAARLEGFAAVGIERDPKYYAIAEKRIHEANASHPLFSSAG